MSVSPKFKLGSQLQATVNEVPIFEWNLCQLEHHRAIAWLYLGDLPSGHPIIVAARKLVKELNKV